MLAQCTEREGELVGFIIRWMEVKQQLKSLLSVERVDKALSVVGTLGGGAN